MFSAKIIKNQVTILNNKVIALATASETRINEQMHKIISFVNDQDEDE